MELEDGCLGGFLSIAELERYFIHGKYNLLYLFLVLLDVLDELFYN